MKNEEKETFEFFVREKIKRDVKSFKTTEEIYKLYLKFCEESNFIPSTSNKMSRYFNLNLIGVKNSKTQNGKILRGRQGIDFIWRKF